jgi:outer membrane receptor protein involved in Fe transport
VEIAGGARYTKETKDSFVSNVFVHSAIATSFPLKTLTDKFSDDNVSPQVTVTWKPSRDLTVYAAHREGYKSGGFNNSFIITAASVQGDGRFGSEDATGNEIGVKGALFDRRMHFDLAIYDYKIKNLQVNIYDPVARASVVTNAGALKTRGIDLSGSFAVSDGFNLRGNVAYNEAKYRNYIGLCYTGQTIAEGCDQDFNTSTANFRSQDFDGRTAPRAPRWSGRFGGSFEQPVSDNLTFSLDGDMSFSSKYYYMDTLRPDGVQKGFTRYDAGIRLRNEEKGWEVALIGRNLTNKLVATGGQDVTSQGSGTGTAGPGVRPDINAVIDQPRQIMLEFGLKF